MRAYKIPTKGCDVQSLHRILRDALRTIESLNLLIRSGTVFPFRL